MNSTNALLAFLLSFVPGLGHLYLRRYFRAFFYGFTFFGLLLLAGIILAGDGDEIAAVLLILAALMWVVNMLDMIISLIIRGGSQPNYAGSFGPSLPPEAPPYAAYDPHKQERLQVLLLSFIPGLGHYLLGLMQRGLTAMITFFGAAVLIIFTTYITGKEGFLSFMLVLPVLWFYTLFDALRQLKRKQAGLELADRSIFEDFHHSDDPYRKNRTLATVLALFPGAAHFYLSMPKRGLQLMAFFLFSFYVLDVLRLSFFLFLIPILWFYSFFDALQCVNKHENGTLTDKPILEPLTQYHRILGFLLIGLGVYYAFKEGLLRLIYQFFPSTGLAFWINNYFQTVIVAALLIIGGIKLIASQKSKKAVSEPVFDHEKKNP